MSKSHSLIENQIASEDINNPDPKKVSYLFLFKLLV